ncbi:class I SAM-dependent methyltransferase [Streptomyces smyrnaeus]|uniref:class I SAM-dependent methyltransferase n=1 Tax=Streptomyces smyrnaeus TaxID=1387713 RepID=UPI003556DD93
MRRWPHGGRAPWPRPCRRSGPKRNAGPRAGAGEEAVGVGALAQAAASAAGPAARTGLTTGDAERLPFPDGVFGAVVRECALCTFPDEPRAAAEFARVLPPGGRVGLTGVTVGTDRLPPELTGPAARIACIADARSQAEYEATFEAAGLRTVLTERHEQTMSRMIDQIEARLNLLRLTAADQLADAAWALPPPRRCRPPPARLRPGPGPPSPREWP